MAAAPAAAGLTAHHRFTSRADGDLAAKSAGVAARRAAVVDLPWTWLRQVHGAEVVTVPEPGANAGAEADAAVTAVPGAVLAVQVADCAPVVLLADGVVGVAHAGWRGLVAGVLPATVAAMRALGTGSVRALLGPCVHPCCYEFDPEELARVAAATGDGVEATSSGGALALDLPAAVTASLAAVDVEVDTVVSTCTACGADRHWSHRARADQERHAALAWLS
ncbi:MAG: polyphenol oxidase family protein [Acidimicrobiales bacterium]